MRCLPSALRSSFDCSARKIRTTTFLAFLLSLACLFATSALGQDKSKKTTPAAFEDKDDDRPQEREKWTMRGREAPKGESAAALRLRAHQQKLDMRAARGSAAAKFGISQAGSVTAGWVPLGPSPLVSEQNVYGLVSGRTTSVAVDQSDTTGNTVYAAGAYGGVWKSTNAADAVAANVTWTPITEQQASLSNGAISVKSDGTVVLVGTGEPNNAIDSYYGVGILRSTDKGASWTLISSSDGGAHPFAGLGVSKFAWVPNSNTVVAATATSAKGFDEGLIASNTNRGLYLSTNAGQTWSYQALADGSSPISVTDVVYNATAGKFFAAVRYHGVYSSTNGTNWTRLTNQPNVSELSSAICPTTVNGNNPCPMYRGQFAVVSGRNEMYFWFIDSNLQDQGIWQSLDGGGSWNQLQPASQCTLDPDTQNPPCGMRQPFYNLELSAMPHGTATDLYAGLVNLYKCRVNSGTQSCATIDSHIPNNWINLTQVYTCSTISGVHPDEHGIDFEIVGGNAIMYFGNDGGVYRSLDGLTKLNSGTCGVANLFDNLNAKIGSMTQFVSFSTHPTDQNTVLGGTQDNGSPANIAATSDPQFFTANGGDGGYNAIDVTNDLWYSANTNVSIQVCNTPPSCNSNNFDLVVAAGTSTIGGDFGAFYSPYILDPQNSAELLLGTCRVWRGSATGSNFSTLSPNFDTGTAATCSGGEVNQIRAIAAGGSKDGNGFSNVVYATSDGLGPLGGNAGAGGLVGATVNAATTQISDVTGSINPSGYSISSVVIDNSDATGKTAYVGIMGFHTSHVWKTIDAGGTGLVSDWSDWSGTGATALPDAPLNALFVDSSVSPSLIYAGTDVGVFVSSTASASWTEVGPAPSSGNAGYLPNVPVSAIRLFNSGSVKKLRVSTYGRGIWEYSLSVTPGFTLSASPGTLSVPQGSSGTTTITVTLTGGLTGSVSLAASGLPNDVTASFNPTSTATTSVLTLTASGSATMSGPTTITITGTSGSLTATTTIALTVAPPPNFTLSASPTTLSVAQGTNGTSTITVTPTGGFTGSVSLAASGLPSGVTASFNPTSTTTTSVLTLTASSSATTGGPTTVTITGTSGSLTATTTVALTVNGTFTIGPVANVTIATPGSSGTAQITVTPSGGFTGAVSFTCTVPASMTEASCSAASVTISSAAPVTASATITTTASHQVAAIHAPATSMFAFGVLAGVFALAIPGRRRKAPLALLLFGMVFLIVSCGGGGGGSSVHTDPGTPAGSYTINLTASGGGVSVPATISVTVQ